MSTLTCLSRPVKCFQPTQRSRRCSLRFETSRNVQVRAHLAKDWEGNCTSGILAAVCGATLMFCQPALAELNKFEAAAGQLWSNYKHRLGNPDRVIRIKDTCYSFICIFCCRWRIQHWVCLAIWWSRYQRPRFPWPGKNQRGSRTSDKICTWG